MIVWGFNNLPPRSPDATWRRQESFSLLLKFQNDSGAELTSSSMGTGVIYLG